MAIINFTKMQGLGNDFVVLDYEEYLNTKKTPDELAVKLCDRHFGIGADGLIIVNPNTKETDIGWIFYNADGSIAQMCGN
jgi:diaminopimelate epimerase